jgi:hypothetical protein
MSLAADLAMNFRIVMFAGGETILSAILAEQLAVRRVARGNHSVRVFRAQSFTAQLRDTMACRRGALELTTTCVTP